MVVVGEVRDSDTGARASASCRIQVPRLWAELPEHMVGAGLTLSKMDFPGVLGKVLLTEVDVLVSQIPGRDLAILVWSHWWQVFKQ